MIMMIVEGHEEALIPINLMDQVYDEGALKIKYLKIEF